MERSGEKEVAGSFGERCNHHYPIIIKVGKMAGGPISVRLERVPVNCRWGLG